MAPKGIIISLDAFIALAISTTSFLLVSYSASNAYGYGFSAINNSYSAIEANLSEQHFLYDQYLSNLTLGQFDSLAEAQGYSVEGFYNHSTSTERGRVVSVRGRAYVIKKEG